MIKPKYVLPNFLGIKRNRLAVFLISTFMFFFFITITGICTVLGDKESFITNKKPTDSTLEVEASIKPDTIKLSLDSLLVIAYQEKFDSLYTGLMKLDKIDDGFYTRKSFHNGFHKMFDDWFNNMEYLESGGDKVPLNRKEYEKLFRKYDKQFARFILYGDEDRESIKFWAKSEAERILSQLATDPESLVIEKVICNGKTKKGWKCAVIYRARNGFGGYVREYITLIMAYNIDNSLYECADIIY